MSPVVLTLWPGVKFPRGRRQQVTWREFLDLLVEQPEAARAKEDAGGFALASFVGNYRSVPTVEKVYALGLDLDDGMTMRQAARVFPGAHAVLYTTFRSTPKLPKLRLLVRLSRPVTGDEYRLLWTVGAARCAKMKHEVDPQTCDPARLWYVPSFPIRGPNHYEWRELRGRALDVERVLRGAARFRPLPGGGQPGGKSREPRRQKVGEKRPPPTAHAEQSFFGRACELAGRSFKKLDNGNLSVECPWADSHTTELLVDKFGVVVDTSTVILPPTTESKWGLFKCSHRHCVDRTVFDLLDVLPIEALEAARIEHGRGFVRVRVHNAWPQRLEALPGVPARDRIILRCRPPIGDVFGMTVYVGTEMHRWLDYLPARALIKRRIDVVLEGERRKVTWARLAPEGDQAVTTKRGRATSP